MSLTAKQARFVEEYLLDLNATQAAVRAGYSQKTAKDIGCQNLAKLDIANAIAEAQAERSNRTEINQDWVLQKLAEIVNANMADYVSVDEDGQSHVDLSNVSRDKFAVITELTSDRLNSRGSGGEKHSETVRTKIKLSDRQSALDKIARHVRFYNDRVEHSGSLEIKGMSELEFARRIAFHLQAPEHDDG